MSVFSRVRDFISARLAPRWRGNSPRQIGANYDAAQTNRHNQNHWGAADYLSPNASNTVQVRHTLRSRSRYEAANNSLYAGILRSIADHTVGIGPQIQFLHPSPRVNGDLGALWAEWSIASQFGGKLWLAKETQSRDGEVFGRTIGNPALESRVKLDYQLLEADYVTSLRPNWTPWQVDGITYDTQWNPISYQIVTQRPNDILPIVWPQQHEVPAREVWHYFRQERPGQGRGVPELLSAFELLAVLRRYIAASVSAAEVAASFAAFIKSNGAPVPDQTGNSASADAWLTLEIQRNLITMLPDGYDIQQLKPEQPTQSFTEFVKTLLTLLVRCVSMPLTIALCDSSGANYSSARMDHQTYFRAIEIDRKRMEEKILARVLRDFLAEAELILGFVRGTLRHVMHEWHWSKAVSLDPQKDAGAIKDALQSCQISITDAHKRGGVSGDIVRETADYFGVDEATVRQDMYQMIYGPKNAGQPEAAAVPEEQPAPPAKPAPKPTPRRGKPDESDTRARAPQSSRTPARGTSISAAASIDLHCSAEHAKLELAASDPGSDPTAVEKFAMVGYTGGLMWLDGHDDQVVIDLTTVEIASPQTPILFNHDDEQPLGHANQVRIDASGISVPAGQGYFSADNSRRDEVVNSARRKYPWQASVGGRAATIEYVGPGETALVNGRSFQGPIEIARGFRLREISILSLGADAATSAVLAARAKAAQGDQVMGFEEWVRSMGFDVASLTTAQSQALQNEWQAKQAQAQAEAAAAAEENEEHEEEEDSTEEAAEDDSEEETEEQPQTARASAGGTATRTRARTTTRAGAPRRPAGRTPQRGNCRTVQASGGNGGGHSRNRLPSMRDVRLEVSRSIAAEMRRVDGIRRECGENVDLCCKALDENWSLEKVQLHVLRAQRSTGVMAGPLGRPAGAPDHNAVIECSMLLALGKIRDEMLPKLDPARYTQPVINAAVDRGNRGYTFSRAIHDYLVCNGRHARGGGLDDETIRAAISMANREIQADGGGGPGFSTVSLPGILSNLLNKSLLASFLAVPTASEQFCGAQDLNDFKIATRYRLSSAGILEKVGKDGELQDFTLGEESWTNQLDTYGKKLTLDRQTMINDDLDAFTNIPRLIGRQSALAVEQAVFTSLLSNPSDGTNNFFSAPHANYLTGAGSALSIAALAAAVPLFLKQTDAQGQPIVLAPAILLVGPENIILADQLYKDTNVVTIFGAGSGSGKAVPQSNPHAGKYRPVQSPYVSNNLAAGGSTTRWWLLSNPADVPLLSVGYLKGQRTPTISQVMTDIQILGFSWQCYFDFGVGLVDWRAGVMNDGA